MKIPSDDEAVINEEIARIKNVHEAETSEDIMICELVTKY